MISALIFIFDYAINHICNCLNLVLWGQILFHYFSLKYFIQFKRNPQCEMLALKNQHSLCQWNSTLHNSFYFILQEFEQDDDCSHSILVSEKGERQDLPPRTEGIWLLSLCAYEVNIDLERFLHSHFSRAQGNFENTEKTRHGGTSLKSQNLRRLTQDSMFEARLGNTERPCKGWDVFQCPLGSVAGSCH